LKFWPKQLGKRIKKKKKIQMEEKEVKLSPFTDVMILYLENPKDSTKNS
jgi:hypothetical protein